MRLGAGGDVLLTSDVKGPLRFQVRCNATEAEQVAAPQVTGQKKKKSGQEGAGAPPGKKKKEVAEQLDTTSSLEDIRTLRVAKVSAVKQKKALAGAASWPKYKYCDLPHRHRPCQAPKSSRRRLFCKAGVWLNCGQCVHRTTTINYATGPKS